MCVIVHIPAGEKLNLAVLAQCWSANPQGAGFMFRYNGKIIIHKGFMTYSTLIKALDACKFIEDGFVLGEIAIHCRIATSGGVSPQKCHPFPIKNYQPSIEKSYCITDSALMHNGVIGAGGDDISDTQEYVMNVVYHAFREGMSVEELSKAINPGFNKFFIMTPRYNYRLGSWQKEDGVFFSNLNYKVGDVWYQTNQYLLGYDSHESSHTDTIASKWCDKKKREKSIILPPEFGRGAAVVKKAKKNNMMLNSSLLNKKDKRQLRLMLKGNGIKLHVSCWTYDDCMDCPYIGKTEGQKVGKFISCRVWSDVFGNYYTIHDFQTNERKVQHIQRG